MFDKFKEQVKRKPKGSIASCMGAPEVKSIVTFPELRPSLVNTTISKNPSGRFVQTNGKMPALLRKYCSEPLPRDKTLFLHQLGGPPRLSLPWYTDRPGRGGRKCFSGMQADAILGPVISLSWNQEVQDGMGFVTAKIVNDFCPADQEFDPDAGPRYVYVNVWVTHNRAHQPTGVSYCEPFWTAKPEGDSEGVLPMFGGDSEIQFDVTEDLKDTGGGISAFLRTTLAEDKARHFDSDDSGSVPDPLLGRMRSRPSSTAVDATQCACVSA